MRWFLMLFVLLSTLVRAELQSVPAELQPVAREQRFEGVIEAVNQATVEAQTAGQIEQIFFDVDDYVERGAVLLKLKDTEQKARVRQAEAALAEATARLREAESEYRRIKEIFARKLVSRSAMDSASAALKAARARLHKAEAALAEAREQLEHTVVRAPYSGIVVERHVEVGELASPGKPLMTGLSLEQLRVVLYLPQRYLEEVRDGVPSRIYVGEDRQRTLSGGRVTVYPYAHPVTHSFRTRIALPDGTPGLYPGMLVKVGFELGKRERLLVPATAVVRRSEVTGLYVLDESGGVHFRQVRLGPPAAEGRVVILAGLAAGERVAIDPIAASAVLKQQAGERR
ncbi:efflux RND transporter periplasmic adaptor subunit [Thiohalobacter sp. IOR34]|uniref:efflux RND transporter periplasmic adaptor subunit n=1 Tax=Thiohalobacter sp. IOR34 TaxID=3057176 RepID=UPI0025B0F76D|nr:efflux RND transporter periplasmic adaptor subunit [Thiohalobacter sp. IOR34]WJW76196.1 efflux RND transporter periplasmic adaptor subunit [Thiohalobacter sp. IOR34]